MSLKVVAYIENSRDLQHPADRRRFCHYAKAVDFRFELFNDQKQYDLIIATVAADFSALNEYKKRHPGTQIIFDYCDNLLGDHLFKSLIRPVYEALKFRNLRALTNYNRLVEGFLKTSDAIICGSVEQEDNLRQYNDSVFNIPDFVVNDSVFRKVDYESCSPGSATILWEGLSGGFRQVGEELFSLASQLDYPVKLLIVTDPEIFFVGDRYGRRNTQQYIEKLSGRYGVPAEFFEWSKENLEVAARRSDFAMIYIPKDNITMQSKPENKLVLLASMGLPVLVSPTAAYKRFLREAVGDSRSESALLTLDNLRQFCVEASVREVFGKKFGDYARSVYSEDRLLGRWENMLRYFGGS